jgi:SAM-dependent methyltransferase
VPDAHAHLPSDYDTDPERFLLAARLGRETASADLHAEVARRLEGRLPVLDVGCGPGALAGALTATAAAAGVVELDRSPAMLAANPSRARVRADAAGLPFSAATFGAVVAINVLYHLPEPREAVAEAHRVLRPGGVFAAATTSRSDSPELAAVWRPEPTTFDAEAAPAIVAGVFDAVDVDRWDAPLVRLADRETVREYLVARFVDRVTAAESAARVTVPLDVTKRGCVVYARR